MTEDHEYTLQRWFEFSGWTMERLVSEIESTGSGRPIPGVAPSLITDAMEGITNPAWKIAVVRAIQHYAITRPWEKETQKLEQQEVFSRTLRPAAKSAKKLMLNQSRVA